MSKFLIGAATAAHQVEGNNTNSDCWAMEQMKHSSYTEPSLDACDHYNQYEEDIRMLADAGLNAYRFSIEWARIEPEEGKFDEAELEHYRRMVLYCKENGVTPIVTLFHFSSPKWLIAKGGWEADSVVGDFAKYVRYVMENIGVEIPYVCTINEANMGWELALYAEKFMRQMMSPDISKPANASKADGDTEGVLSISEGAESASKTADGEKNAGVQIGINMEQMLAERAAAAREMKEIFGTDSPQVFLNPRTPHGDELIMQAHRAAVDIIHELAPHTKAGITFSLHDICPMPGGEDNAAKEWEAEFTHYLPMIRDDDFLGIQNYTRSLIGAEGTLPNPDGAELTQAGYEYYPQALEHVIRAVAKDFHGDLLVTENGIATSDDARRIDFIEAATQGVANCIADQIPVKGYMYWSLLDNFEWQKGFAMTYGLTAVDRKTQARYPKPSLAYLGNRRSLFE